MLQYKDHRFHWKRISIEIPDGFYWDDKERDYEMQQGIFLLSPEKDYSLIILICDDTLSAYEELLSTVKDFTIIEPVSEITVNGLHGYHAAYRTRTEQYYEAQLDVPGGIVSIIIKSDMKNILGIKDRIDLHKIVYTA